MQTRANTEIVARGRDDEATHPELIRPREAHTIVCESRHTCAVRNETNPPEHSLVFVRCGTVTRLLVVFRPQQTVERKKGGTLKEERGERGPGHNGRTHVWRAQGEGGQEFGVSDQSRVTAGGIVCLWRACVRCAFGDSEPWGVGDRLTRLQAKRLREEIRVVSLRIVEGSGFRPEQHKNALHHVFQLPLEHVEVLS